MDINVTVRNKIRLLCLSAIHTLLTLLAGAGEKPYQTECDLLTVNAILTLGVFGYFSHSSP